MTHRLASLMMMTLLSALVGCASPDTPSLPPPPPPAAREAPADLQMRLDYGGAQAMLDALEKDTLTDADVDALLRVDGVAGMVKNVTRFVPEKGVAEFRTEAATFARTKRGGDNDGVFQLSSVWEHRAPSRDLIGTIRADETRIVDDALALLAPYLPATGPLTIRVHFVAGGVSDGFVFEDDPQAFYINVTRAGGDLQEVLANIVHEAYHVAQIAAQKRSGTFAAWIADDALPPVQRLLAGTLLEGTAALVSRPDRFPAGAGHLEATRGLYRRAAKPKTIAENFALFDRVLSQLQSGKIPWEEAYRRGFSHSREDEERFYFVGYEMAAAIERYDRAGAIGALFEKPPVAFFRRYLALCRQHRELPGRFSEATARQLAGP